MTKSADDLSSTEVELVEELLRTYDENRDKVSLFLSQLVPALTESKRLDDLTHSIKWRVKERDHLEEKVIRKLRKQKAGGAAFEVTPETLLSKVTDLAGVRILHLYTRQVRDINEALQEVIAEQRYTLLEGPFARTWDDESREYFRSCGIETQESRTLYTSVHYVIGSASRTFVTCEIQVRTLMEEVWGEVDHAINYPEPTENFACSEQLKVLARVTSSATRLVDSIFLTLDHDGGGESGSASA
jgi:putative GTP pyrophosphokinase